MDLKWHNFKPNTPRNRQKLPPEKRIVLVELKSNTTMYPNPIVCGYLKFHAGDKSAPYFVTHGCNLKNVESGVDDRVVRWCDCLPDEFEWYNGLKPNLSH